MNQQFKAYLISLARLFVSSALTAYFITAKGVFDLDFKDGKGILAAAVGSVLVSVFNALNPKDQRYGIGAPTPKDQSAGDVATNAPKDNGYGAIELLVVVILVVILVFVVSRLV